MIRSKKGVGPILFLVFSIIGYSSLVKAISQPFPKIHFQVDNWTEDMKRVGMTTLDRGLKLKIDFTNLDTQNYYTITYIKIRIETTYEEQTNSKDWDYVEFRNYAIPPNNTTSTYYEVDLHRSQSSIGKWSVRLGYVTSEYAWDFSQQIEPFPFEFKVASEGELQNAISANPRGWFIFSPNITIDISILGGITIPISLALLAVIWKRKKGKH